MIHVKNGVDDSVSGLDGHSVFSPPDSPLDSAYNESEEEESKDRTPVPHDTGYDVSSEEEDLKQLYDYSYSGLVDSPLRATTRASSEKASTDKAPPLATAKAPL